MTCPGFGLESPFFFIDAVYIGKVLFELSRHIAHLLEVLLVECRSQVLFGLVRLLRESVLC